MAFAPKQLSREHSSTSFKEEANMCAPQPIVSAITADMQSSLREVTFDNHVVIPFHAHIVKAWR
jgi:hypothetical protein